MVPEVLKRSRIHGLLGDEEQSLPGGKGNAGKVSELRLPS